MKKTNLKKATIALLACLTCVGAFAWLSTSDVSKETQSITAGTFAVEFNSEYFGVDDETGDPIEGGFLNEKAAPMSEEDGKAQDPYLFTVENTGDINMALRIGATNVAKVNGSEMIPNDLIHVVITDVTDTEAAVIVYEGDLAGLKEGNGATDVQTLDAGAARNYELVAWIDAEAVNADLIDIVSEEAVGRDVDFDLTAYVVQADGGIFAAAPTNAEWAGLDVSFE